jgi:DNA replication protein DnaC
MDNDALLETYLRRLRLPTFAKNYGQFAQDAAQNNLDYARFLLALAEQEVQQREHNMIARRTKSARFPVLKELADFDFSAVPTLNKAEILDLARGEYLQQRESILLIGNPGTAANLVNELLQAQDEHRLHRFIATALKLDLVVLDELGFIPFTTQGAQALFTFCSELYERLPFIITTNLKFADWVQVFGDERLTAALLDRLTHHARIIELIGESFRFRQRLSQR